MPTLYTCEANPETSPRDPPYFPVSTPASALRAVVPKLMCSLPQDAANPNNAAGAQDLDGTMQALSKLVVGPSVCTLRKKCSVAKGLRTQC